MLRKSAFFAALLCLLCAFRHTAFAQAPSAPTLTVTTPSSTSALLSWTASTSATSYNVYKATTSGGEGSTPVATGVSATSYTDSGLTTGDTYYYVVTAVNSSGEGPSSGEQRAVPMLSPANFTAVSWDSHVQLSWSAVGGSLYYDLYRSTTPGGEGSTPYAHWLTSTNYTDWSTTVGTTYYYTLVAVAYDCQSAFTGEVSVTLLSPPAAPTLSITMPTGTSAALSWTASTGATSYNIYRWITGNPQIYQPGITGTSYTDTGLSTGTTYSYEVTAVSSLGEGPGSNWESATPLAAPTVTATPGNTTVTLTWSAITGAGHYIVYRGTTPGGESSNPVAGWVGGTTTYTDQWLTNGTTYYYTVAAAATNSLSAQSAEVNATPSAPTTPPAPTSLSATPGDTTASLSWTGSTGATSYNIYRSTTSGGESITPIATNITGTTFGDTGLTDGTTYYYEVTAVDSGGVSGMSNEANATPVHTPPSPTNLTATAQNGSIYLKWTGVTGATSYNVYVGTTSGQEGSSPAVSGISSTTYTDSTVIPDTVFYFVVTAVNSSGESGPSNEAAAASFNLRVSDVQTGSVVLLWDGGTLPSTNGDPSCYSWSGSDGNSGTTKSPTVTDSFGFAEGTTYTYTVTEILYSFNSINQEWTPQIWISLGKITVTIQQMTATDNQAVDSRLDTRCEQPTFLNFNFGTEHYKGGLFAGFNSDPSRAARSFLRFNPPTLSSPDHLWASRLNTYCTTVLGNGETVGLQNIPDTGWTINNLTWSSAPQIDPTAATLTQTVGTAGSWYTWPLYNSLDNLFSGGQPAVLVLGDVNEATDQSNNTQDWVYFAKKEYSTALAPYLLYAYGH